MYNERITMENIRTQNPAFTMIFQGIALALLSFSFAFAQILITFGQKENARVAVYLNIAIATVTAVLYVWRELTLAKKELSTTPFAIAYFCTCAVSAVCGFHFIANYDFALIYNENAAEAYSTFRVCYFYLCALYAVILVARIGVEFSVYIKKLKE